jgi:hypothetical protein
MNKMTLINNKRGATLQKNELEIVEWDSNLELVGRPHRLATADPRRPILTFSKVKVVLNLRISFFKRLPGVGSEPGSSRFNLFSPFHHFTAEPQRLP